MTAPTTKQSSILIRLCHVISILSLTGSVILAAFTTYVNNRHSTAYLPSEVAVKKVAFDEAMWANIGWIGVSVAAFMICKASYYVFKGDIEPEDKETSDKLVALFIAAIGICSVAAFMIANA